MVELLGVICIKPILTRSTGGNHSCDTFFGNNANSSMTIAKANNEIPSQSEIIGNTEEINK
jgi:hypothetical protein